MKARQIYFIFLLISLFFALALLPLTSGADSLDNWVEVTSPSNHWLNGMIYGNGFFVTVGDYGTILTSTDGTDWSARYNGDTHHLFGIGYGNGTYVAAGTVGTILTSTGGPVWSWTYRSSGTSRNLYGVAYGNNRFVVVGASGTILTSSNNGATWSNPFWPYVSPTNNWFFGVVWGWEFAAVGSYDGMPVYSEIFTSTDGASWSHQDSGTTEHLKGIAYGAGTFVAIGDKGLIISSTNGTIWTVSRAASVEYENLNAIAYGVISGTGYFVAVGQGGTILTAPDADVTAWTYRNSGTTYDLEAIAFDTNNSTFATAGGYGIILLDGDSLPTNPVRISEPYEVFFATIQDAYNNMTSGDLESMALLFYEDLDFNIDKPVTLKGGYNATFTDNPSFTTLNGSLTVSDGTVVVEKLVIQ